MGVPTYKSSVLITRAYRVVRSKVYECLDGHDLNATQWSIMGVVYEAENGISLSEVAKAIGVKKPLVTLLVDKLVDNQILKRTANEFDSRSKLLFMKPQGISLMHELESSLQEILSPLFLGVTDHSFDVYLNVLSTVVDNQGN
jgi:DNA-binding MarR family transcriptional regulator